MSDDFAPLMRDVALRLLGDPNEARSSKTELRYGQHGSLAIDLSTGRFYDHEKREGGGVVALIQREHRCDAAEAFDWLVDQGLAQRKKPNGAWDRKEVARYEYQNADGRLLYVVVRLEPKDFRLYRPHPTFPDQRVWGLKAGEYVQHKNNTVDWYRATKERTREKGWTKSLTLSESVTHSLFNLPAIAAEMRKEEAAQAIVYLPEGEKDCLTLAKFGLLATTNSGGAKYWTPRLAKILRGADVVIPIDNDEAGRKHGDDVAASLSGIARRVRVLDFGRVWPECPKKGDVTKWFEVGGGTSERLAEIVSGLPEWTPTPEAVKADDGKPQIVVTAKISEVATQAQEMLKAAGLPLYQRGDYLVRPLVEEVDAAHGRKTRVVRLRRIEPVYLRDLMDRSANWFGYDGRTTKGLKAVSPPLEIAAMLLARGPDEWGFPAVAGVISTPTMRPDGSLLVEPGYDEATRLLLIEPPPMPPIPDNPTRDDALAALTLYEDLLVEFPLKDDVSKAVALSGCITPVVRGAFSVSPLHVASAPVAGTGKSYLWDTASAIAIGQIMPVISTGPDEEELEKRLGTALMTGQPFFSIDNVIGELGGAALCQVVERPVVDIRILGKSERVRIESRGTTLYSTGNNIVLVGDLCRRAITTRLDAKEEHPEQRKFNGNPVAKVLENRGAYIAAALTVCRAYIVAGRCIDIRPLASFEGWSKIVREALIWLGKADCAASIETAGAIEPERVMLREMLTAWGAAIGIGQSYRCRLRDLIEAGAVYSDLSAAISATDKRGMPDVRSLGNWAQRNRDRMIDGLRLVVDSDRKHGSMWWVEDGTGEDKPPTIPTAFTTIMAQIKTETEKAVLLANPEAWLPKSMIKMEAANGGQVKIMLTRRLAAEKGLLKDFDPF